MTFCNVLTRKSSFLWNQAKSNERSMFGNTEYSWVGLLKKGDFKVDRQTSWTISISD